MTELETIKSVAQMFQYEVLMHIHITQGNYIVEEYLDGKKKAILEYVVGLDAMDDSLLSGVLLYKVEESLREVVGYHENKNYYDKYELRVLGFKTIDMAVHPLNTQPMKSVVIEYSWGVRSND